MKKTLQYSNMLEKVMRYDELAIFSMIHTQTDDRHLYMQKDGKLGDLPKVIKCRVEEGRLPASVFQTAIECDGGARRTYPEDPTIQVLEADGRRNDVRCDEDYSRRYMMVRYSIFQIALASLRGKHCCLARS